MNRRSPLRVLLLFLFILSSPQVLTSSSAAAAPAPAPAPETSPENKTESKKTAQPEENEESWDEDEEESDESWDETGDESEEDDFSFDDDEEEQPEKSHEQDEPEELDAPDDDLDTQDPEDNPKTDKTGGQDNLDDKGEPEDQDDLDEPDEEFDDQPDEEPDDLDEPEEETDDQDEPDEQDELEEDPEESLEESEDEFEGKLPRYQPSAAISIPLPYIGAIQFTPLASTLEKLQENTVGSAEKALARAKSRGERAAARIKSKMSEKIELAQARISDAEARKQTLENRMHQAIEDKKAEVEAARAQIESEIQTKIIAGKETAEAVQKHAEEKRAAAEALVTEKITQAQALFAQKKQEAEKKLADAEAARDQLQNQIKQKILDAQEAVKQQANAQQDNLEAELAKAEQEVRDQEADQIKQANTQVIEAETSLAELIAVGVVAVNKAEEIQSQLLEKAAHIEREVNNVRQRYEDERARIEKIIAENKAKVEALQAALEQAQQMLENMGREELEKKIAELTTQAEQLKGKEYRVGPIVFKDIVAQLGEDGTPQMSARMLIPPFSAHVELEEMNEEGVTFLATFDKELEARISSRKKLKIKRAHLLLAHDGPSISLWSESNVFNQDPTVNDVRIQIGLIGEEQNMTITAEKIPLIDMVPAAEKNERLKPIIVNNVEMSAPSPLATASGQQSLEITITGDTDLSHIPVSKTGKLGKTNCSLTVAPDGFTLLAEGTEPIVINEQATLENPVCEIGLATGSPVPQIRVSGQAKIVLPLGIGYSTLDLNGEITSDSIELTAQLDKKFSFAKIKVDKFSVVFKTEGSGRDRQTNLSLVSDANILNYDVVVTLKLIKNPETRKTLIEFSGKLKNKTPLKPLKDIELLPDDLKNLELKDPYIGISSDKSFFFGGDLKLFGVEVTGQVKKFLGNGIVVKASTKKPWRVSDSVPSAKGSVLDAIKVKRVVMTVASKKYFDTELNLKVNKGFSVFATIATDQGVFEKAKKILGSAIPEEATIGLTLNPNIRKCKLSVYIPTNVKLSDTASMSNLVLEISGEPSIAILAQFKVIPSEGEPPLIFTARIELGLGQVTLAGTMEGRWNEPFGISGFALADLAVEVILALAIPPVPKSLGITGKMEIGDIKIMMAFKAGSDGVILMGSIENLKLSDIVKLAKQAGVDLGDVEGDEGFVIEKLALKFAPTGGSIGEIEFDPGISADLHMRIKTDAFETRFDAGLNIDRGIKVYAMMPNLKIGPLDLKGAGLDREYGTEDDGPIFYLAMTPTEQRLFISADATFLNNKIQVEVDISPDGIYAKFLMQLFDIFELFAEIESYKVEDVVGMRFQGNISLASATLAVRGNVSSDGHAMFHAYLNHLYLSDLAEVANKMGANINPADMPKMGLEKVNFLLKF